MVAQSTGKLRFVGTAAVSRLGPSRAWVSYCQVASGIYAANVVAAGSAALTTPLEGPSSVGKKNSIQIRHAQLKYLSVGLKLKLTGPSDLILVTYPT